MLNKLFEMGGCLMRLKCLRWLTSRRGWSPAKTIELKGDGAFDFEVVGEASYQKPFEGLAGGRWEHEADVLCRARLLPEATNAHDRNAVAVYVEGLKVAYLDRRKAAEYPFRCAAECNAVICGGWDRGPLDRGHFGLKLDLIWPPVQKT
jgi:hypothetical protein